MCWQRLFLFLLAGLLLCLLRFLSHVALRDPNVGSAQADRLAQIQRTPQLQN
jgi:hypothetical protein